MPASTHFMAVSTVGTAWYTTMPASLSGAMNLAGLPAEVVTNLTPELQTKRSMASSFRKRIGRFTPKGKPSWLMAVISAWQFCVSPEDVSITPRPPARDTAEANGVRAIQPMGAWMMGYFAPVWARTRFKNCLSRSGRPRSGWPRPT